VKIPFITDTVIELEEKTPLIPTENVICNGRLYEWDPRTIKPLDGAMTALFIGALGVFIYGLAEFNSLSAEVKAIGSVCVAFGFLISSYYFYGQKDEKSNAV
jgi:hypothetical protein